MCLSQGGMKSIGKDGFQCIRKARQGLSKLVTLERVSIEWQRRGIPWHSLQGRFE